MPLIIGDDKIKSIFVGGESIKSAYVGVNQVYHSSSVKIYGATWDGSETTKLTRTGAAKNFENPRPAVGTGDGWSPFDNIMPWAGMTQVVDGENVLVAIPKYYLKVSHNPFTVQISSEYFEGSQVSPAHRDREDGYGERDVVYVGRYECDRSYMSRSGNATLSANCNGSRNGISDLGPEYWQADYALQLTLWYLYLVEFADWNGNEAIGPGVVGISPTKTGSTDSMTYHTGQSEEIQSGVMAIQYRNIENFWGNKDEFRDGIVSYRSNMCTYNNPSNFSSVYDGPGAKVRTTNLLTNNGYIKAWAFDPDDESFIYPGELGGSDTQYTTGYYKGSTSTSNIRSLQVSGYKMPEVGTFFFSTGRAFNVSSINDGSRIQKLPMKK